MTKRRYYLRLLGCCYLAILLFTSYVFGQKNNKQLEQRAQRAQQAQREGDFAKAIREYIILSRLMPGVAEVHSNLGVAYYFHMQRPEALTAFKRALKLKPDLTSALIFSGIVNFEMSRTAQAIKLLERSVELNSSDPLAQTWLAYGYAAQSRFREAVERFLIASRLAPNDVDILYGLGKAYVELGQQEIEWLTENAPNGGRIFQLAGDLWMLRGEEEKALSLYQEAFKRRPDLTEVAPTHALRTTELITHEDEHYLAATEFRERAKQSFERIVAINPDSHRAHQILAESLIAEDRLDEAITEYRTVLSLKPDLAGIHKEIGDLFMSFGKAAEALDEYRTELTLRPNDAQLYYRIGRSLNVLGKGDEAESSFKHALVLGNAPPSTHRELGRIYLSRGGAAKALHSLSIYLSSTNNATKDSAAHYLLMRTYSALGNQVMAEHHLKQFKNLSDYEKRRTSIQEGLSLFNSGKIREQ